MYDRRVAVVEHVFAPEEEIPAALREGLASGSLDTPRRDLAAITPASPGQGIAQACRAPIGTTMTAERSNAGSHHGALRLLAHVGALARMTGDAGPSARERLEHQLAPELARLLVAALVPRRRRAFA